MIGGDAVLLDACDVVEVEDAMLCEEECDLIGGETVLDTCDMLCDDEDAACVDEVDLTGGDAVLETCSVLLIVELVLCEDETLCVLERDVDDLELLERLVLKVLLA